MHRKVAVSAADEWLFFPKAHHQLVRAAECRCLCQFLVAGSFPASHANTLWRCSHLCCNLLLLKLFLCQLRLYSRFQVILHTILCAEPPAADPLFANSHEVFQDLSTNNFPRRLSQPVVQWYA